MRGHALLMDLPLLLVACCVASALAQYDDYGPAPPRLNIAGAVALGPAPSAPRRAVRVQARRQPPPQQQQQYEEAPPAPRLRSRPGGRAGRLPVPVAAPSPTPAPQFFAPPPAPAVQQRPAPQQEDAIAPRPVNEEPENEFEDEVLGAGAFSPSPSPPPPPPPPPPQPAFRPEPRPPAFRPTPLPSSPSFSPSFAPSFSPSPSPELNYVSPTRQQLRPTPPPEDQPERRKPAYNRVDSTRNKVRPTPPPQDEPQYTRAQFSGRPQQQQVVRAPPQKPSYANSKQDYEKPQREHQREKKPVAQVLRRYREENEDGSITWGYENDDGSFKEETIGTDCVTYGKYGYVDPDGNRREYTYSTGIPCDKNRDKDKDNQEQPSEGYIDYAENKYVLPNGDSIDLNKMVKNRARRPVQQQQQQQQYRN